MTVLGYTDIYDDAKKYVDDLVKDYAYKNKTNRITDTIDRLFYLENEIIYELSIFDGCELYVYAITNYPEKNKKKKSVSFGVNTYYEHLG